MKKLINGLKKIFLMVGVFLNSIYTKVIAVEMDMVEILYGPPIQPLYGIAEPEPEPISIIWKIVKLLIIPIAFIIGTIVYFKKSSSSILRKIITILIALVIVVLVCL